MGAMDWLRGVMGPSAFGPQGGAPGMPGAGGLGPGLGQMAAPLAAAAFGAMGGAGQSPGMGPPPGGQAPFGQGPIGSPFGAAPFAGAPIGGAGGAAGYPLPGDAFAQGMSGPQGYAPPSPPSAYAGMPGAEAHGHDRAALEARVAELSHDVESLALFARTLLTVMVERKVLTTEQFAEAKNRIDMLDGRLDDKVAKGL